MKTDRYRSQYLKWHRGYEKRAQTELLNVFKSWAYGFKPMGQPNQYANQMDSQFEEAELIKAFANIYQNIGIRHGARMFNHLNPREKKNFQFDMFKEAWQRYLAIYLQQNLLQSIIGIRSNYIDWLSNVIIAEAQKGTFGGVPDSSTVATWLQEQVRRRDFYRWQALRIARTESTAASNLAGMKSAENTGIAMDKVWVSAHDARTRRQPEDWYDHWRMDGIQISSGETFKMVSTKGTQDELMYPGDPKGHPANIINCRCTLVYRPKKKDGRYVRR